MRAWLRQLPPPKGQSREEIAKIQAYVRDPKNKNNVRELADKIQKDCARRESSMAAELSKREPDEPPGRLEHMRLELASVQQQCRCGIDFDCMAAAEAVPSLRMCSIVSTALGPITFERTGRLRWVAKLPATFCPGIMTIMVLERDASSAYLWSMTQTRVGSATSEGSNSKLCSQLELNKPMSFSWRYEKPFAAGTCHAFKFGP